MGAFMPWHLFPVVFIAVLLVWPFWRIIDKAGFPAVTSLLMLIPVVNVVVLFYLAFAEWPALRNK
jgi:type VI protein secretion system component VasK